MHREGHAVDRGDAAEGLAQALHLEHGASWQRVSVPDVLGAARAARSRDSAAAARSASPIRPVGQIAISTITSSA